MRHDPLNRPGWAAQGRARVGSLTIVSLAAPFLSSLFGEGIIGILQPLRQHSCACQEISSHTEED
jgi:hypothetical protein